MRRKSIVEQDTPIRAIAEKGTPTVGAIGLENLADGRDVVVARVDVADLIGVFDVGEDVLHE